MRVFGKRVPPTFILLVFVVWVGVRVARTVDLSAPTGEKSIYFVVVCIGAAAVLILEPWRSHRNCSLFFSEGGRSIYDIDGNYVKTIIDKTSCGRKSVGKVKTTEGKWEYFCRRHHPVESRVKYWLTIKDINLQVVTLKMFRFVEEDDSDSAGPQAGPPRMDLRLP